MLPLRDDNPTLRTPVVTILFIVVNVAVWIFMQGGGAEPYITGSLCHLGLIPADVTGALPDGAAITLGNRVVCVPGGRPDALTLLSSMFMHGSWVHILGNLWFLWIFGNNVEDSMGRLRFLVFYVLCGLAAAGTQIAIHPSSTVPMVGASGAIGGVMGAYTFLYPRVRVHLFVFLGFYVTRTVVPAYLMLGYWFLLQVVGGLPQLHADAAGVAFWAHVGGFLAGLLLLPLFKNRELVARHRALLQSYEGRLAW